MALNFFKFLIVFPVLVMLGIITKILDFYYLEVVGLFVVLAIILWLFRIPYKGSFEYHDVKIDVKIMFNVFNYKFIKLTVIRGHECLTVREKTRANTSLISEDRWPFDIKIALEISNEQKPEVYVLNKT